jgi:hypothetical protein
MLLVCQLMVAQPAHYQLLEGELAQLMQLERAPILVS